MVNFMELRDLLAENISVSTFNIHLIFKAIPVMLVCREIVIQKLPTDEPGTIAFHLFTTPQRRFVVIFMMVSSPSSAYSYYCCKSQSALLRLFKK